MGGVWFELLALSSLARQMPLTGGVQNKWRSVAAAVVVHLGWPPSGGDVVAAAEQGPRPSMCASHGRDR